MALAAALLRTRADDRFWRAALEAASVAPAPEEGILDNPGAWLMVSAKRRGIDALRRRVALERKQELIGRELQILSSSTSRTSSRRSTARRTTSCVWSS